MNSTNRWFYILTSLSLIIVLHVLAVRSGLVVFYLSFLILLATSLFKGSVNKAYAFLSIASLLLGLFLAINFVPSLKNKISYMKHDYHMFMKGKGGQYSDSERLYSYKVGWEIFKESPVLGSGMGDLLDKSEAGFKTHYDLELSKYPHNMYLFLLSGLGLFGFVLFFVGLLIPVFRNVNKLESVFSLLMIMLLISFMVENTLQRSYSTAFFLFFYLAGLCYMEIKKGPSNDDPF